VGPVDRPPSLLGIGGLVKPIVIASRGYDIRFKVVVNQGRAVDDTGETCIDVRINSRSPRARDWFGGMIQVSEGNAERAYEVLLQHQPGPYHEQEKWASYRGERLALLRCRRSSHPETHDQFRSLLDQAKFELRGAPEDTQTRLFARGEE
jgi:hypothetical protein